MFGGRWSQFPQSDETARAQWLEQIVTSFSPTRGHRAGISICIRRSAPRITCVLACCRSVTSPGGRFSALAGDAGLEALVFHQSPGDLHALYLRTLRRAGLHAGAGKALPFGQNDLTRFAPTHFALRALLGARSRSIPASPSSVIGLCSRSPAVARLSSYIWRPTRSILRRFARGITGGGWRRAL